jgi:nitroreductase
MVFRRRPAVSILELATAARSVRRFEAARAVPREVLRGIVGTARIAPCGANLQQLRFAIMNKPAERDALFPLLRWAACLKDWRGPSEAERPAAYVVILAPVEERLFTRMDVGIAAGYMTLAAREQGLGCCMILSFDREKASEMLSPPPGLSPILVLALGYPAEEVVLEALEQGEGIEYWRDPEGRHHVPKRSLEDLLLEQPACGGGLPEK